MNKKNGTVSEAGKRLPRMRWTGLGLAAFSLLLAAGCGGGGGGGTVQPNTLHASLDTTDQTFSDGSYVDIYVTTASADGMATVEMDSDKVDSFLLVGMDNGSGTIQTIASDDNSAGGHNAKASFQVTRGSTYQIAASTSGNGSSTGSYTLVYSNELGKLYPDSKITTHIQQMQSRLKK